MWRNEQETLCFLRFFKNIQLFLFFFCPISVFNILNDLMEVAYSRKMFCDRFRYKPFLGTRMFPDQKLYHKYPSNSFSVYLSIYLFIYMYVSIYLSFYLSIYLSKHPRHINIYLSYTNIPLLYLFLLSSFSNVSMKLYMHVYILYVQIYINLLINISIVFQ